MFFIIFALFFDFVVMRKELEDKITKSCLLIRHAERHCRWQGLELELAYSGGKDSDVMLELCRMSGIRFRAIHRNTTIDPPYTLAHCRANGVEILRGRMSFSRCIVRSGFPNRYYRHCCGELKEYAVLDYVLVGVRRSESTKRKSRYTCDEDLVTYNGRGKCIQYYPLKDWDDNDIRDFVNERGIKCHPLYYDADGVFHVERRLGCMCCPLQSQGKRLKEFERYPKMVRFYLRYGACFMRSKPNSSICSRFHDVYEWFVHDVFCSSEEEFLRRFRGGELDLFGNGSHNIDCKAFLESHFGIDLSL